MVARGKAVHDPSLPQLVGSMFYESSRELTPLENFCETKDVLTPAGLEGAPAQVQQLLEDNQLRPEILKYLKDRRMKNAAAGPRKARVWADEEEREEMKVCHARCIEVLKKLLGPITHRSFFRALDVAGGRGRLAEDFLLKSY